MAIPSGDGSLIHSKEKQSTWSWVLDLQTKVINDFSTHRNQSTMRFGLPCCFSTRRLQREYRSSLTLAKICTEIFSFAKKKKEKKERDRCREIFARVWQYVGIFKWYQREVFSSSFRSWVLREDEAKKWTPVFLVRERSLTFFFDSMISDYLNKQTLSFDLQYANNPVLANYGAIYTSNAMNWPY